VFNSISIFILNLLIAHWLNYLNSSSWHLWPDWDRYTYIHHQPWRRREVVIIHTIDTDTRPICAMWMVRRFPFWWVTPMKMGGWQPLPFVGKMAHALTMAQLLTLDPSSQTRNKQWTNCHPTSTCTAIMHSFGSKASDGIFLSCSFDHLERYVGVLLHFFALFWKLVETHGLFMLTTGMTALLLYLDNLSGHCGHGHAVMACFQGSENIGGLKFLNGSPWDQNLSLPNGIQSFWL
jgi:hypothetical protein